MTGQAGGAGGAGSGGGAQGGGQSGTGDSGAGGSIMSQAPAAGAGASSGQGAGAAGAGQGQGGGAGASGGAGSGSGSGQGQGQGQGAGQQAGAWAWADGTPGTGDRPAWFKADKYASVAKQAEALPALEAKLGPAAELIGAPEGAYAIPALPQGMEGEVNPDDPLLKGFAETAKKLGLSQKAFDSIVQDMRGVLVKEAAAEQAHLSEAIAQLGQNVPARVQAVQTYVTQHMGAEAFAALDAAVGTNAEAFKALEQLVARASGDARLATEGGNGGLGFDKAAVEAERYKVFPEGHKMAGKSMYEYDAQHRAKVDGMWKKLYPGEDRQAVG
jgi:hypothetical protein